MAKELTNEKLVPFAALVHALDGAIQTRSIYPPKHPMLAESAKGLKVALDAWFRIEGKLDLGFSPKNLLLNGQFVKDKDPVFVSMANYFHSRGLLALTVTRGVSETEIGTLFDAFRGTPEAIAEAGGVATQMRACAHITIKEIDYRVVLAASRRNAASDPIRLWESLCRMGDSANPTSETMMAAIKDTGKVADAVNAAFAVSGKDRAAVTAKIWQVLGAFGRETAKLTRGEDRPLRQSLSVIAAKLNPELLVSLFEKGGVDPETRELQGMLLNDLPEDVVAGFIVSIIDRQGKIDRNLIDLFGKLSARPARSTGVSSLVAEKLLQESQSRGGGLDEIREAIQEALKIAPRDDFMSKIYKLTVDTVSEKVGLVSELSASLKALVQDYEKRVQPANTDRERAELLLNVLWFESDPVYFRKFSDLLIDSMQNSPADRVNELARDALTLYSEKSGADSSERAIARESEIALSRLGKITGAPFLVSLIPKATDSELRGIGLSLDGLDSSSAGTFLDAFLAERSILGKERFAIMLSGIPFTEEQMEKVVAALDKESDPKGRDIMLAVLLGGCDEKRAHALFAKLRKGFFVNAHLRAAVRICGERRMHGTVPHLANILAVRPRLDWRGYHSLRTAAATSLIQIGSPEARQTLEHHGSKKDRAVRQACEKVIKRVGSK